MIRECSNVQFLGFWSDLGTQNYKITSEYSILLCQLGWYSVGAQFVSHFAHHYFSHDLRHDPGRETVVYSKSSAKHQNVLKVNALALST